jgi:hypothetical protein
MAAMMEEQPPAFDEIVTTQAMPTFALQARIEHQFNDDRRHILDEVALPLQHRAATSPLDAGPFAEEEEELPQYDHDAEPVQLPDYEERHRLAPVVSYNVYQINRKLQVLTPATRATFDRPRYRIVARSGPSIFSKKADFTLTRLPTGATAATENCPGKDVGFVSFDSAGQLPWMPRATVKVLTESGSSSTGEKVAYNMCAPNFADWKFTMNNEVYSWRLTDKPTALSLMEHSSSSVFARFTYSIHGTAATRGADVGVLDIFGGSRSRDTEVVEMVLSTCQVPVNHWKNMGRHYRNGITPRNCSVVGPVALGSSFFASDGRVSGIRRASNAV